MSDRRVRVASYAVCVRDAQVLLVHQVCPGPAQNQWTLPGGGVEFGESPRDALTRELAEEVGVSDASIGAVLDVHDGLYQWRHHQRHAVRLLFDVTLASDPRVVDPTEVDLVGWFDLDALPEPCTPWARVAADLTR